jgi:hypothetical protein
MRRWILLLTLIVSALIIAPAALACGGLFCQNVPVDQQAERIIFTVNDDETITAYVQINYTGSAPDFSWVVPVPSVPDVDVAEIATFDELSRLTAPTFIPPLMPACAPIPAMAAMAEDGVATGGSVQVLASGAAGPYFYNVITSPNPVDLIRWLRANNYRITEQMEPLVKQYTDEGKMFLAMKLQPEQGVQDIQPVKMTYEWPFPEIPIRLTAVAANPDMTILTWVFANEQAYPLNYAHPAIKDEDLRSNFGSPDGTNYRTLVNQTVDLYGGRAFVTEYAQPTSNLISMGPQDPLVVQLVQDYDYVTRFLGFMSPEEMTVDPIFELGADLPDVPAVRDLSGMKPETFWGCEGAPAAQVEYDPAVVP